MSDQPKDPITDYSSLSLNEVLALLGLSKRKAQSDILGYSYDIYNASGALVFTGDAYAVWDWLRAPEPAGVAMLRDDRDSIGAAS